MRLPVAIWWWVLVFLVLGGSPLYGQAKIDLDRTTLFASDKPLELPAVNQLIDSALRYSPVLLQQDAEMAIKQLEIIGAKRQWLDFINGFSDVKYGSVDNFLYQADVDEFANSSAITTRYNLGLQLKFSVFDLVDRRRKKKIALLELDKASAKHQELEKSLKQQIITLYNDVELAYKILEIKSQAYEVQAMTVTLAEKQFAEGTMELLAYSGIMTAVSKAATEYEIALKNYHTYYQLLEELCGVDLAKL